MDLSETIIAAIIGAGATMATAIFQLLRNRAPSEVRPRKNRIRSLLATIVLMLGCIVGGYAWSSLRAVNANEQMRATMQAELTRQFAALSAQQREGAPTGSRPDAGALPVGQSLPGTAESLVQLPPCTPAERADDTAVATCTAHTVHELALCAALPSNAQDTHLQLMVRTLKPDSTWQKREADSPTIGDLHIGDAMPGQSPGSSGRPTCLNVANWSVTEAVLVRLLVDYTLPPKALAEPAVTPITAALK